MNKEAVEVDRYIEQKLLSMDEAPRAALARNAGEALPAIDVSPAQGKLLNLLVRLSGARRVLEIGTLGGYSTIWMASALPPGGRLVSLEYEPRHAAVARANLSDAGLQGVAEVRVGRALDLLPGVEAEDLGPFDLVFIDADKASNVAYVQWALRLSRPGSLILVDNVVRDGRVLEAAAADPNIQGVRALFDFVSREPRLDATALQTIGLKGWDGLMLALVK